jgi:hypothetical protein
MTTHYPLGTVVHADGTVRAWTVIAVHRNGRETFARLLPPGGRRGDDGPRTVDVARISTCTGVSCDCSDGAS